MGATLLPRAVSDHMAALFADACQADPNYLLIFRSVTKVRERARQESPDIPVSASPVLVSFRPGDRDVPAPGCPLGALAERGRG